MTRTGWIASVILLLALAGTAVGLAAWKRAERAQAHAAAAAMPEPMEVVGVAEAAPRSYVRSTSVIGTVRALRSVALRNELAGTVREVHLTPGQVVEEGTLLVALDVSVERAELAAQQAQAALAETLLGRVQRALENKGASEIDVDRARAERDVALANVARTQAIIDRKTLRAPFRAHIGMSDVHEGQYLNEGTELTTLQGIDEAAHVDFAISQAVAHGLAIGGTVEIVADDSGAQAAKATIVALDARVDETTRNVWARARVEGAGERVTPGASVRVRVPIGDRRDAVVVPTTALRKGPAGDHVFKLIEDPQGNLRAQQAFVRSGAILGDVILIEEGLSAGERVAAAGSFKLREGVRVAIAPPQAAAGAQ